MMSSTVSAGDSIMPVLIMSRNGADADDQFLDRLVRLRARSGVRIRFIESVCGGGTGSHWPPRRKHSRSWLK